MPIATSAACSPKPCALVDGLQLTISDLERSAPSPAASTSRPADTHYVRFRVTFTAVNGDHTVPDPRPTSWLIDEDGPGSVSAGYWWGTAYAYQLAEDDWYCGAPAPTVSSEGGLPTIVPLPLAHLKQGQHYGPMQLCYWVKGPVDQRLTFGWEPSTRPSPTGVFYTPVEIPL